MPIAKIETDTKLNGFGANVLKTTNPTQTIIKLFLALLSSILSILSSVTISFFLFVKCIEASPKPNKKHAKKIRKSRSDFSASTTYHAKYAPTNAENMEGIKTI
jgi:hypothetical protein